MRCEACKASITPCPLYSGGALVKLADGNYQSVTVLGLDDTSLFGRPQLMDGKIQDIYAENGFHCCPGCRTLRSSAIRIWARNSN